MSEGCPSSSRCFRTRASRSVSSRRNPSFAITAILTLAIGIGGTTAIFSVLDVVVLETAALSRSRSAGRPPGNAAAIRPLSRQRSRRRVLAQSTSSSFDRIALVLPDFGNLTGHGEAERLQMGLVTPMFLRLLGAQATTRPAAARRGGSAWARPRRRTQRRLVATSVQCGSSRSSAGRSI